MGLLVVTAGVAAASVIVKPSKARAFHLFYGSVFLNDDVSPVAVDLASGKPTVRLANAVAAVSAKTTADLDVTPLAGGNTLMLNPATGEFNMVDSTGFVVKPANGGVRLPRTSGPTTTSAIPSGGSAYLVRSGPARTSVYLVGTATVATALGPHAKATARAFATLSRPLADEPGAAASSNGNLWVLTGDRSREAITELSVPAGSNAGTPLTATPRGMVSGPAAVATATGNVNGSGAHVPAVATARGIDVFSGASHSHRAVPLGPRVDTILPASNAQGSLVFLYHDAIGWSRVTAAPSGAVAVKRLPAIPAASRLAVPAESDGRTYTMDVDTGRLWQIDGDGVAQPIPGAGEYPFRAAEVHRLTAPTVFARGSRVIFNSRSSLQAEVVFSDGSHPPRTINKQSAVTVDPAGAAALADAPAAGRPNPASRQRVPANNPAQTINNKINCTTTHALPHRPTLIPGVRAARSISLTWVYPVFEPSDCIPSTYVVSVQVLTPGAPTAPSQVTVQGQDGVTLTHLFPATEYQLSVAAYLNGQHTTSEPIRVTTGPEGPAAPTAVRASTDSSGNWTVSWTSCGGISQDCVPSTTWYVLPRLCDGRGLAGVPSRLTVAGDPTQHAFTATYPGSDALLGRGMCFQVQGVSPQGTIGDTSASSPIAYSWTQPDAAALTLDASQPPPTTLGASTTTRVDLALGSDPTRAVGGVGARITFTLNTPSGPRTQTVTWDGTSNHVAAVFSGIQAGASYTAQATVAPPGHPANAVTTALVTVATRSTWPQLSASASCPPNPGLITSSCNLIVRISGVSSGSTGGEMFDASGTLTCGSTGMDLAKSAFDPGQEAITRTVDLFEMNGQCQINLQLAESASDRDPKVFGGAPSPTFGAGVDLGGPSRLGAGPGDFTVGWNSDNGSSGDVRYVGSYSDAQVAAMTDQWSEQLRAPDGTLCGSSTEQPTHDGIDIPVDPACVNAFGDQNGWTISVAYDDRGTAIEHQAGVYTLNSGPPSYMPCTVTASNFSATWASDPTVDMTFTPGGAEIGGCSNWSFAVADAAQDACGQVAQPPGDFGIPISSSCTPGAGYTVTVSYQDPAGHAQQIILVVEGTPP